MLPQALYEKVYAYLYNEIDRTALEEWITPRLLHFLHDPILNEASDNAKVTAAVELGLAEMHSGARSEEQFKTMLREVMSKISGVYSEWDATDSAERSRTFSASNSRGKVDI